ncbi:NTP transferase domain-containing protein [Solimonas terrae]|uniref:NTP transferase domain-containing protein n=1 Tax=Solimonas terrae TaxID=1396819 RepID=A0A6M2BLQ0_9GAMM|nr:NTP transferase domain-containing protein [Solimonas terrae]
MTALVLAGSRGPHEALAVYAGVSHKALIEIGGRTMVERVVEALAGLPEIARIVVMIEEPALLDGLAGLRRLGTRVRTLRAAGSPSLSVNAALEQLGTPLLVTTADHALLETAWVRHFLEHCPADRDVCVALARRQEVVAAVPDTQRTWLRFADGQFSGCNLFYLATPAAGRVVRFWRQLENDRKQPLKMLRRVGYGSALRYVLGRLSLVSALDRIGERCDARAAMVELPFGRAAVDVDKPSDLDLVRRLVEPGA